MQMQELNNTMLEYSCNHDPRISKGDEDQLQQVEEYINWQLT